MSASGGKADIAIAVGIEGAVFVSVDGLQCVS
jgi:hypothetical protein